MSTPAEQSFSKLLSVMDDLRSQCPWDKKQTFESLRHLTIEETYELSEAIQSKNADEIKKELGDVLLHIIFYSKMGSENNWFNIQNVMDTLVEKLIRRHPHIYGNVIAEDEETVKKNWEQIKLSEGGKEKKNGLLDGVPASMPSMIKAMRMQEKAAQVGFDWPEKTQVWAKVKEELLEFESATNTGDKEKELGDLFFALINYARFEKINPDDALEYTNRKFKNRFEYIESQAASNGKDLSNMSLDEMDIWWNESKKTYQ